MYMVRELHEELFAGLPGQLFLGVMGGLFVVAIISGAVVYGPFMRKLDFGTIRRDKTRHLKWLDLHNLLGIVTLTWAFVVGVTGVMNTLAQPLFSLWRTDHLPRLLAPYQGKPLPARLHSVQGIVDTARQALPDTEVVSVVFPWVAMCGHVLVKPVVTTPATQHRRPLVMPDASPLIGLFMPHPTASTSFTAPDLLHCLEIRRSVKPAALSEPGPNPDELRRLLTVASRVPDHGALVPWRFILFQGDARQAASAQPAAAYLAQHPELSEQTMGTFARLSRLFPQAPLVVAVVSRADPSDRKPEWEQVLTAGTVCMNLITAATTLGYASVWLTGWAAYNVAALAALGVRAEEKVAGFIHIGTAKERPPDRSRPDPDDLVTEWTAK